MAQAVLNKLPRSPAYCASRMIGKYSDLNRGCLLVCAACWQNHCDYSTGQQTCCEAPHAVKTLFLSYFFYDFLLGPVRLAVVVAFKAFKSFSLKRAKVNVDRVCQTVGDSQSSCAESPYLHRTCRVRSQPLPLKGSLPRSFSSPRGRLKSYPKQDILQHFRTQRS